MTKNFVQLDESKFPTTKGKNIDGFRFYAVEDKHFPSITTVLGAIPKPGLIAWRKNVGEEAAKWEMNRAARRGSATHTLVEQYLKGETPSIRDVLPLGMFRLLKPYLDQVDNIHALEQIMYSKKLTVAGQVDCIAEYNGKLSVIDFKTANKERKEEWIDNYFMQCTAYGLMYEEMYNTEIEDIVVIMGGEDGSMVTYVKKKADYISKLEEVVEDFYKMFNLEYNEQQLS